MGTEACKIPDVLFAIVEEDTGRVWTLEGWIDKDSDKPATFWFGESLEECRLKCDEIKEDGKAYLFVPIGLDAVVKMGDFSEARRVNEYNLPDGA